MCYTWAVGRLVRRNVEFTEMCYHIRMISIPWADTYKIVIISWTDTNKMVSIPWADTNKMVSIQRTDTKWLVYHDQIQIK